MYKGQFLSQRLFRYKRRRAIIGEQLDRAYGKNNISNYIALEEKYTKLSLLIESMMHKQSTRKIVKV